MMADASRATTQKYISLNSDDQKRGIRLGISLQFEYMFREIVFCLLLGWTSCAVLASADFVNYAEDPWAYSYSNSVGLSMDLAETTPYLGNALFKLYMLNSNVYGNWYNNFNIHLHNPGGYKYNCTLMNLIANTTVNCTFDMSNSTFMSNLGSFNWDALMTYGLTIGWDNIGAEYTNSDYMTNGLVQFLKGLRVKSHYQSFFTATAEKADTYNATGIRPGYTYTQPAQDCSDINRYISYWYASPGLTPAASKDWYTQANNIAYQCGIFTLRSIVFPDTTKLTIDNLLSETYTSQFIRNRVTVNGTSFTSLFSNYLITMSDLRLVEAYEGVSGLTNSFAAAIWAIEFTMEWIIMGGYQLSFFNPIGSPSFQSIFGQSPYFQPTSIYYGLLLAIMVNNNMPWIMIPTVVSGTSNKIKAYGFDNYGYYAVLILNKDTSPSAKGTVDVKISYTTGIRCMYLSAPSLSSTTGISFNGYSFTSNNSQPQGEFVMKTFLVGSNGMYSVPLSYAEVVYCKSITATTYYAFPRFSSTSSSEYLALSVLLLILSFII